MAEHPATPAGPAVAATLATLAAWQACGADAVDPVRFVRLAALARRAARHGGAVEALLQPRLAALLADYQARLAAAGAAEPAVPAGAEAPPSPLRALRQRLDAGAGAGGVAGLAAPAARVELKALQQFRGSWAQLNLDHQLRRSRAQAPGQAGPLNSHRLAVRTLQTLRGLAPGYLQRLVSQLDTLQWLEAAQAQAETAAAAAPRSERARKRRVTRSGLPGPR